MIITKELENGLYEVSSDKGKVDIGVGAVDKLIIGKEEIEYVTEELTAQQAQLQPSDDKTAGAQPFAE